VFECGDFAKVPENLIRKLGLKAFRGVMVGYSQNSPGYRVYNSTTRGITTSVHVKFHESVPGFGISHHVDLSINVVFDADGDSAAPGVLPPADVSLDNVDLVDTLQESYRPTRVRGPPAHFEDYVAHVSIVPRVCVTNVCSPDLSDHGEGIVALPDFFMMVAHPRNKSTEGPVVIVALTSASVCRTGILPGNIMVSPKARDQVNFVDVDGNDILKHRCR
jgi:hypothetical protein